MSKRVLRCAIPAVAVAVLCLGILVPAEASQKSLPSSSTVHQARPDYGRMPVHFIPNRGQIDGPASYYVQGKDKSIFFGSDGLTFILTGAAAAPAGPPGRSVPLSNPPGPRWVVKLDFVGARADAAPEGADATGTAISYFEGAPETWKTGLPAYARVVYKDLWPGIDLAYAGAQDKLKYEFVVHPGADPSRIRLAYRGASSVTVDKDGRLAVSTPAGGFEDGVPVAYQEKEGRRVPVAMSYEILDGAAGSVAAPDQTAADRPVAYGFALGDYDRSLPLVLDPVLLLYCGFFGGPGSDYGYGITADSTGSAYITGYTYAPGSAFPTKVGPDLTYNGGSMDAFVAKLTPDGTGYVYCGYIGGAGNDYGYGIAVDAFGCAYVAGYTSSAQDTFPVKVGPTLSFSGDYDAFVAKVNAKGTGLVYCGYIGGTGPDFGKGVAVDATGNAYVCGYTDSNEASFPVTVGPYLTYSGAYDAFVAKVAPDGSQLVFCGYIGGAGEDVANAIAVDGLSCVYITGYTFSDATSFPVTLGPSLTPYGLSDAFVAKVNNDGQSLAYCGYIGGGASDIATGIAVDLSYAAYVCGYTDSTETTFPVTVGPDLTYNGGGYDAFVAKVDPTGSSLTYCGFIGGALYDAATAIAVDGRGYAFVTGYTSSAEDTFPIAVGPFLTHSASYDAFVAKVDLTGKKLLFCTYLGGTDADLGQGIALDKDGSGNVYVTGNTYSKEDTFPTQTGPDLTSHGGRDGFVAKLQEISLAVTSPNGDEVLRTGYNWVLTWLTSGQVDRVTIQYSVDDGTNWFMVAYNIPNTGSYTWMVPDDPSENCLIRVSEASTGDPTDDSDAVFTISDAPILVVTSPNGGEQWPVGSTQTILWTSANGAGDVLIEYSTDDGTTWTTVVADTPNTGSYPWVVPDTVSDLCLVRLSDVSNTSTVQGESASVFSISGITLTSPNGGEQWAAGSTQNIVWQWGGPVGDVKIEYSTDQGATWTTIVDDTPNTGSYAWVVPATVSDLCLVRVTDTTHSAFTDTSDQVFSITASNTASAKAGLSPAKTGKAGPPAGTSTPIKRRIRQGASQ